MYTADIKEDMPATLKKSCPTAHAHAFLKNSDKNIRLHAINWWLQVSACIVARQLSLQYESKASMQKNFIGHIHAHCEDIFGISFARRRTLESQNPCLRPCTLQGR
jgi:hypothetical protein